MQIKLITKIQYTVQLVLAALVFLIASTALYGWYSQNNTLVQLHASYVPMMFNTALGFLIASTAILVELHLNQNRFTRCLGLILSLLATLTLLEYSFNWHLGIDELFFKHYISVGSSHSGRMAPNTALCFLLLGITFLLRVSSKESKFIVSLLPTIVGVLGIIALLGYLLDLPNAYGWGQMTRMALNSSVGFVAIALALVIHEWRYLHNLIIRHLLTLPLFTLIVSMTFFGILDYALIANKKMEMNKKIIREGLTISSKISEKFSAEYNAFIRLFDRVVAGSYSSDKHLDYDANNYLNDISSIAFIKVKYSKYGSKLYYNKFINKQSANEFYEKCRQTLHGKQLTMVASNKQICVTDKTRSIVMAIDNQRLFSRLIDKETKAHFNIYIKTAQQLIYALGEDSTSSAEYAFPLRLFKNMYQLNLVANQKFLKTNGWQFLILFNVFCSLSIIAIFMITLFWRMNAVKNEALVYLENRNTLLINAAGEGIYGLDRDGKTEFVNPAAAKMLGYAPDELIGLPMHQTVHYAYPDGSPYPVTNCPIAMAIHDGEVRRVKDEVLWRKDGSQFWVEYTSTPIIKNNEIKGAVVVFSDITKRKEVESMKEELVSTINHELRTPLTAIRGSVWYLLQSKKQISPEKQLDILETCYKNCDQLSHIVNDILDADKIAAGEMTYHFEKVPAVLFCTEIIKRYQSIAAIHDSRYEITTSIENDVEIEIDPNRFEQVILNVLSNAAKYSFKGSVVKVSMQVNEQHLFQITVSDQGDGIPAHQQSKLFTKFSRLDNGSTRKQSGTGLGLYISREIIRAMQGDIYFDSTVGVGSNFYITVPMIGGG